MPASYSKKEKSTKLRRLNQKWFNTVEEENYEDIEKRFLENEDLFLILAEIIAQKIDANAKSRRSKGAYDKPAFSEFQADCNGYERALEEMLTYLKITKEI
jgi:hypothetical protein